MVEPLFYSEWDDSVVSAQRDNSSPLSVGSKTKVMRRMGPLKTPTIEELVQLDPPRQFTNRGVTGPLAGNREMHTRTARRLSAVPSDDRARNRGMGL